MNKQFTFTTENAVQVLNQLAKELHSYKEHGESLFSDTLKHRNAGRVETYTSIIDYLTEVFQICGLEILQLESENVEEETQVHTVNPDLKNANEIFGNIMFNAFSHFSK